MARPTVTIPSITIFMEMAGYGSLTEWLTSPDAKRIRQRAQMRMCKQKARRAKAVANLDATAPSQGSRF
jgi:hypothetical protein